MSAENDTGGTPENDIEVEGTKFSADKHKRTEKANFDLKKENLKKVFGSGWGLFSLATIAVIFIAFLVIGYLALSRPAQKTADRNPNSAVLSAPSGAGDSHVANTEEADARRLANNERSAEAAKSGTMFMPPAVVVGDGKDPNGLKYGGNDMSTTKDGKPGSSGQADPAADRAKAEKDLADHQAANANQTPAVADGLTGEQRKKLADDIESQVLQALGRPQNAESGKARTYFVTAQYALPDRTPKTVATAASSSLAVTAAAGTSPAVVAAAAGKKLTIGAGEQFYCQLEFVLNSDSARTEAFATCLNGKAKNARLIGKYEMKENAGSGLITTTFSSMSFPGKPQVVIEAVALDESTGEVGMADESDSHTLARYGGLTVASFLRGMGQAAAIVTGSTVTQSTGAVATTMTVTNPITVNKQLEIAAGATGSAIADSIQKRSDAIKETVKVYPKNVIIKFLKDVYE